MAGTLTTDVLIVGGGIAGLLAALAVRQKLPSNRQVTILEPSTAEARNDYKVGEALIEWSVGAMARLGLFEYIDQEHPDKYGLSFHMRKGDGSADTYGDYYHLWGDEFISSDGGLVIHFPRSFFIDRVKFESSVSKVAKERGVQFVQGSASDISLADAPHALHTVTYRPTESGQRAPAEENATAAEAEATKQTHTIKCRWVLDCAGRRFFIARKTGILRRQIRDLDTGAAWVRVRNFDTSILGPFGNLPSAEIHDVRQLRYLSTSHWIGRGHWLWTIPLTEAPEFMSIGVVYHYEHHESMDTQERFLTWLEANHNWLARLIRSGTIIDFQYRHRLAYRVDQFVDAQQRWAVCGDAAAFMDAMYSQGIALSATAGELAAAVLTEDLADRPEQASEIAANGNAVMGAMVDLVEKQFQVHRHVLHDPQAFSIQNAASYDSYIGNLLPAYLAQAHTLPTVGKQLLPILRRRLNYWDAIHPVVHAVAKRNSSRPSSKQPIYEIHGTNLGLYFMHFKHERSTTANYDGITPMDANDAAAALWFADRIGCFFVGELSARHGGIGAVFRNFLFSWLYLVGVFSGLSRLTRWFVSKFPLLGKRWAFRPGTLAFSSSPGEIRAGIAPVQPGMSAPQFGCGKGLRIDPTKLCMIPTKQPLHPPTDGALRSE